ncbi:MAG: hypothetical protein JSV49_09920 [Thermoplasmata archaeon]|nr:MAG: hypothetical protein JSV49_09920 [Thermoplasmata archaeon]
MAVYQILKADLTTSYRIFIDRTFRKKIHELRIGNKILRFRFPRILTIFFIIVSILAINLTIRIILFLNTQDLTDPHIMIESGTFALFFFLIIFLRVMLYTYRKVLKAEELHYIFSIPINLRKVILGKYLANLIYIIIQLFTGFVLIIMIMYLHGLNTWIPISYVIEGFLLIFLACSLGFTIPIFLQVKSIPRKIVYMAAHAAILSTIMIPIRYTPTALRGFEYLILLGLFTALSFLLVLVSEYVLVEAWLVQISKPLRYIVKRRDAAAFSEVEKGEKILGEKELIIGKKDIIFFIREKDVISTVVASIALLVIMFGLFNLIGPHEDINMDYSHYIYPTIIGIAVFLGAVLQCSLIGLASISMEGKPFWVLKSMPVTGKTVLKGKSLAIFTLAFPTVILITVPLPILDGFPVIVGLFFSIEAAALVIAFTGLGIWSGAKMPNFDETMRNMPDLVSQFSITFISAIIAVFLLVIPAAVLEVSHIGGFFAALDAVGWSIVLYIWCIEKGQKAYDDIGSDQYL